jgi:AcrR family transcriptional regulator
MSRRSLLSPDESRGQILAVAERLFRSVGYAKTTIADIAKALGMSPANVYRFFPSKSAINNEICDRLMGLLHAGLRVELERPGTAVERLTRFLHASRRFHTEMFTDQRVVFDMVDAAIAENWGSIVAHIQTTEAMAAAIIATGMRDGEFAPGDAAALGSTVMKACCCMTHPTLIAQSAQFPDHEKIGERLIWLVIEALRNPHRSEMP